MANFALDAGESGKTGEHIILRKNMADFRGRRPLVPTFSFAKDIPMLTKPSDIKWAANPNVNIPYRRRILAAVKSVDVLRRRAGLPLLSPFLRIGQITFYKDDQNLYTSLGFSEEAFFYALLRLDIVRGERRVALHGLLLCEKGQLATQGPAAVWHYTQGDVLFFSDSRTGMSGMLSHTRCREYIERSRNPQYYEYSGQVQRIERIDEVKSILKRCIESDLSVNPLSAAETEDQSPVNPLVSVMSTLEYISALCVMYKTEERITHIKFNDMNPMKDDLFERMESAFYGKGHDRMLRFRLVFHEKPPYDVSDVNPGIAPDESDSALDSSGDLD